MPTKGLDPICAHCVEERNDLAPTDLDGRMYLLCRECRTAFFALDDDSAEYLSTCNDSPNRARPAGKGKRKPSLDELDREDERFSEPEAA